MGLKVVGKKKKNLPFPGGIPTMTSAEYQRAIKDARILVEAEEIKRDAMRYRRARDRMMRVFG